ncbi:hypothetical protein [Paraburkholderia sp. J8-2]|uniref:hypothetical protein n=1 Tax=Paraburkholderia sp. J8-2 TaxID=2805440 RepID=UPI002AB7B2BD|nr:hypothetical protein [Paraburkholderia sp. J8-2]
MDRKLANSTTTRILPVWPPFVFTIPQTRDYEDCDPVGADKNDDTAGYAISPRMHKCIEHVFGWSTTPPDIHSTRTKPTRRLSGKSVPRIAWPREHTRATMNSSIACLW